MIYAYWFFAFAILLAHLLGYIAVSTWVLVGLFTAPIVILLVVVVVAFAAHIGSQM